MSRILIVDDEEAVCWALQRALARAGHQVQVSATAEEALNLARRHPPDAVLLDVRLPGMSGLTALGQLRALAPRTQVIVVTAFGNLDTAVQAVAGGAFDYLAKPFDLEQALDAVARALARNQAPAEAAAAAPAAAVPGEIIGTSAALQSVFKRIALVAPHDACVVITGESGSGKELVARAIHRHSPRRHRPFLPVHVAALNPQLVESELFGHVKGAFTGATQSRPGLLTLADGGTVFLDEVADIPLEVQVKLLRALEHREVVPVGAGEPQTLNLRILAATHQDLSRLVREGRFRHDLYFRLNVFQIHVPPLRDRPTDILPLAEHFLRQVDRRTLPLPEQTVQYLVARPWPGNVRELRHALEHAAILARGGPLLPEHFPPAAADVALPSAAAELDQAVRRWVAEQTAAATPATLYAALLRQVEPALLDEVLRRVRGNRWEAARWLGLNRATVRKKLGQYGLSDGSGHTGGESP